MNHFRAYARKLNIRLYLNVAITALLSLGCYIGLHDYLMLDTIWALAATVPLLLLATFFISSIATNQSMTAIETLWQAIWHVSPNKADVPAPQLDAIKNGRELLSSMVLQIYDLASQGNEVGSYIKTESNPNQQSVAILPTFDEVPVPIFILDSNKTVTLANKAGAAYLNKQPADIVGKSCFDVLKFSFTSNDTVDGWIESSKASRATDTHTWEHVRIQAGDTANDYKQCDISASYSKDNTSGHETVITLFDRSKFYDQQDTGMSYIALAVHELRTPLTILRGYIEVFEEELDPMLTPELREFMRKMGAAAQNLTAFVSNILNVARVDENQLVLSLHEANWGEMLPSIIENLELRASVRGKHIELKIDPNLPAAAVDEISIYEVVSNLVDNAVKYSGPSPKIVVSATLGADGSIETVVQDFGIGLPANAVANLFTKYYRSHKSRSAVSGSGLGLYLVKAMVTAHGGRVWVNSKEGEGSSFGFSLQPYANIASQAEAGSQGIERQASGWIKNHSMYR